MGREDGGRGRDKTSNEEQTPKYFLSLSLSLSLSFSLFLGSLSPQANTTASIGGEEAYGGRSLVRAPTEDSEASESNPLLLMTVSGRW